MLNKKFKSVTVNSVEGKVLSEISEREIDSLSDGDITISVEYSCLNYKDALAITGKGKIMRNFPCIAGIDLSGKVIESKSENFKEGDKVVATSYDIGVAHDGGLSEIARIPSEWIVKLPENLTTKQSMYYGTAGYTAALAIERLENAGLSKDSGKIVVNGSSGGVGSLAISMLSQLGYEVVALTGKPNMSDYLKKLGASDVIDINSLDFEKIRPLDKSTWAGAIDNLGGSCLSWMLSQMKIDGLVAAIGLASSFKLNSTVMPFILRGVSLLGIDSVNTKMQTRKKVWDRIASDLKVNTFDEIIKLISLNEVFEVSEKIVNSQFSGRAVVDLSK